MTAALLDLLPALDDLTVLEPFDRDHLGLEAAIRRREAEVVADMRARADRTHGDAITVHDGLLHLEVDEQRVAQHADPLPHALPARRDAGRQVVVDDLLADHVVDDGEVAGIHRVDPAVEDFQVGHGFSLGWVRQGLDQSRASEASRAYRPRVAIQRKVIAFGTLASRARRSASSRCDISHGAVKSSWRGGVIFTARVFRSSYSAAVKCRMKSGTISPSSNARCSSRWSRSSAARVAARRSSLARKREREDRRAGRRGRRDPLRASGRSADTWQHEPRWPGKSSSSSMW